MIGVNVHCREPKKLKEVMNKENLHWRSFVNQEAIFRTWNPPGTPAFYLVDHKGVIRYKWVGSPGEKAIDAALEKLIHEAERDANKAPN